MVYQLPIFDITVITDEKGGGYITTSLKEENQQPVHDEENLHAEFDAAMDGIESMILACACNGIDISSLAFVQAIQTSVEACENKLL